MVAIMKDRFIFSPDQLRVEIKASHFRSKRYNIDRETRDPDQVKLTPAELELRRAEKKEFLSVVTNHISEF